MTRQFLELPISIFLCSRPFANSRMPYWLFPFHDSTHHEPLYPLSNGPPRWLTITARLFRPDDA